MTDTIAPPLPVFLAQPIVVRRAAANTDLAKLNPSVALARALDESGLRTAGALAGRRGMDLTWLAGMRSTVVKELHKLLVAAGALEPIPAPLPARPGPRAAPEPRRVRPKKARAQRKRHPAVVAIPIRTFYIRPEKRDVPFDSTPMSTWLTNTLSTYGIDRLGDLNGRSVRELASMRRIGRTQLHELHGILVAQGALAQPPVPPPPRRSSGPLAPLMELRPNPLRRELLAPAPPYTRIRFAPLIIRRDARPVPVEDLPLTGPLGKLLRSVGCVRLADLDGRTPSDLVGGDSRSRENQVRQLYGLLTVAGALDAPRGPLYDVPRRLHGVAVDDVRMRRILLNALRQRGVKRLGDIASLTPATLALGFGRALRSELAALVERLPSIEVRNAPFARAVDEGLARLPARERQAILIRFGAKGRPLTLRAAFARLELRPSDPPGTMRDWTGHLLDAAGPSLSRSLRELRIRAARRRGRLPAEAAAQILGLRRSKRRYTIEFYLRLVGAMAHEIKIAVAWGKAIAG